MSERKSPPLVALVVRWAMLRRRQGAHVPAEVVNVLVCAAERHNAQERCSRPGNFTLGWDVGAASKDYMRKWLRVASDLGAVTCREGKGRGHATEIRFTDDVLQAPQLDHLSRLDQVRLTEAAAKDQCPAMPSARPLWKTETRRRHSNALFEARKGRVAKAKRATPDPKRATGDVDKGDTASPPTAVTAVEPLEPLVRPSAASISDPNGQTTDNGNGASKETDLGGVGSPSEGTPRVYAPPAQKPDPLSRVEQIRRSFQGSGRYVPLSEDADAARRALLSKQAEMLKAAGGGA